MSDTPSTPTITDADIAAASVKILPYLTEAAEHGIALRPITGLMLRLGDQFGVDINAVGEVTYQTADKAEDEELEIYYDQLMLAVWVLAEKDAILTDCAAEGGKSPERAYMRWKLSHLNSLAAEAAAMRAFIGRWIEHRLEMARVYGSGEASTADA